jgi:beta-lactamase superfamily II metal-dependent hydrolase
MPKGTKMDVATMEAPASGVRVRMYNPGFGDCFLLAFRGDDGSAFYMLIDCGVHNQYTGGSKRLKAIARDIEQATGGHLHAVVVTHEHADHTNGFTYGKEIFDGSDFEIDELWLAWTENADDPAVAKLKRYRAMKMRALAAAAYQLAAMKSPLAEKLQGLLGFELEGGLGVSGGEKPLDFLRRKSKRKLTFAEDYLRPGGKPKELPGASGVKIYVLGPSTDPAWIKKRDIESEMYPGIKVMSEVDSFAAGILAATDAKHLTDDDKDYVECSRPFIESFEIKRDAAATHTRYREFFRSHYGFSNRRGHGEQWRRIDTDWYALAERLAIDLDEFTNNTSLALAIELSAAEPRKVLLFPGDAQVANWISWDACSWSEEGPPKKRIKPNDLLERTVLYKVGHHGSRNATLKRSLEAMNNPDLVAMIPVDEAWARSAKGWKHPAEKLLERIREKTRGRIIRADEIPTGKRKPKRPRNIDPQNWKRFLSNLDWDGNRLWIEYTVAQ